MSRILALPRLLLPAALSFLLGVAPQIQGADVYHWTTYLGNEGGPGHTDATGAEARLSGPAGLARDINGNIYIADQTSHVIRKMTPAGEVTTLAGKPGRSGWVDGQGSAARFNQPMGLTVDGNGNVFVADSANNVIRKISPAGLVTTLCGTPEVSGYQDGPAGTAKFFQPTGLAVDGNGNVFVADKQNHAIRKVLPNGSVSTIGGVATQGYVEGSAPRFYLPSDIVLGPDGYFYIADTNNRAIRKMSAAGETSTLAGGGGVAIGTDGTGSGAGLGYPTTLTVDDAGNIHFFESRQIRKITPEGVVTTRFDVYFDAGGYLPCGIVADAAGDLYVSYTGAHEITKVTSGGGTTVAGKRRSWGYTDGAAANAQFDGPAAIEPDGQGGFYVLDRSNHSIRQIAADRSVSTLAGNGTPGHAVGTGSNARFSLPNGMARGPSGNLYVTDGFAVRKITPAGEVTTLAGDVAVYGSVNGPANVARFDGPYGLAVDQNENVFVTEYSKHTIRKITPEGVVSTIAGMTGTVGSANGPGPDARFSNPGEIAIDAAGNLFVSEFGGHTIRKITPQGVVSAFVGQTGREGSVDGTGSAARFTYLSGMNFDSSGNLLATDYYNHTIRKITPAGVVTTIGGIPGLMGNQPGSGEDGLFMYPSDVYAAPDGVLYVAGGGSNNIMVGTPAPEIVVEQPLGHDLAATGNTANWGDIPVAEPLITRTFTIANRGIATLNNLAFSIDGDNASEFTVTTPLGQTSLAPGASTTFVIRAEPTVLGLRTAVLHLTSDDPDEGEIAIILQANGIVGTPPVITSIPEDFSVEAIAAGGAFVTFAAATAVDDVEVVSIAAVPSSGSVFALGTHTVTVTATDQAGHSTTDTFTVTVQDTTAPALTAPETIKLAVGAEGTLALPDLTNHVTATDAVGVTTRLQSPAAGTVLHAGIHPLSFTYGDAAGNTTTVQTLLVFGFDPVTETETTTVAQTLYPAPATEGLHGSAYLYRFNAPAISDQRDLAAKGIARIYPARNFETIYQQTAGGEARLTAFATQPIPPTSGLDNVTFKSFGDPLLAEDGTVAFAAKLQGTGVITTSNDDSVWTDALGSGLRLVLREGSEVLPGLTLKAVTSLSLRNGELLVLATLKTVPGSVTTATDTVVLRLTGSGTELLLREGDPVQGIGSSKIKTISILSPASGSPGHGRWHAQESPIAKVTLTDGRTSIVHLRAGANPEPLLTTLTPAVEVDLPMSKWSAFGLPAVDALGHHFVVQGTLKAVPNIVSTSNDVVLLYRSGDSAFEPLVQENDLAFALGGPRFASFREPVINTDGEAAFVATLRGPQTAPTNNFGLWRGTPGNLSLVARLGGAVPDADGQPVPGRTWGSFLSYALPNGSGPLFTAMIKGPNVTGSMGLWAQGADGVVRELIRGGTSILLSDVPGASPYKIKTITLMNAANGVFGTTRSFNSTGSVAVLVTFTDNTQALLRLDLP